MKRFAVFSLAFATLWLAACSSRSRPNIILIVVDTLRPDRLGAYDRTRGLTPFLDSFAQRAHVFANAYAPTSWTNASIASLLTSRYQSQHRVLSFQAAMSDQEITLTQVLKEHGYATGGFSANFLLRADLGFGRGFDAYRTLGRIEKDAADRPQFVKDRADKLNREALAWLDELASAHRPMPPVFLYLHYMEPHNPYDPPAELLDKILGGRARPDREAVNQRMRLPNLGTFSDEFVQDVQDLYDAEVMSLDGDLRQLFDGLRARGVLDDALVVITADHGEEFREHGLMGHHQTLYEEVLRIPLLISLPGQERRVDVERIVSLVDLAPTLLDLAGIPPPPAFMGHSVRPLLRRRAGWWPFGDRDGATPLTGPGMTFSELIMDPTARQRPHERAVVAGTHKLIVDVDGGREFYDLRADPSEANPQALGDAERAELVAAVEQLQGFGRPAPSAKTPAQVDSETRERMRALGYAE